MFSATGRLARCGTLGTLQGGVTLSSDIGRLAIYRGDGRAGAAGERGSEGPSEPVAQIAKAIQSQTAELANLVRYQGSGAQPAGTVRGLGRQSEELVFLMRACGQYSVKVGEGEHGQGLANALLAAQVGASTKLRHMYIWLPAASRTPTTKAVSAVSVPFSSRSH